MEHIIKHSTPGNPRNSEGSFVKLADGTLFFAYSRYTGESCHDHAAADIAAVTSKDGGKTWSEPFIVLKNRQMNLMSVSLLRLSNGRIAMVYLEKSAVPGVEKLVDCRPRIIFSDDECASWSDPVIIDDTSPAYFVVNNDRLIQLANGRLLIPAAHHEFTPGCFGDAVIRFFISDDSGQSWRMSGHTITPPHPLPRYGMMEPGIIELADGPLMCFIRTAAGCHYKSFSYDKGESWSEAVPAPEFPAPSSPMSIKRDPVRGRLYAIWNDYSPERRVEFTDKRWARTPLVMAESGDEGVTWEKHRILEDAPDHGYCYIGMFFDEDQLHLSYCCGGEPDCIDNLQETKLRTIAL